MKLNVEVDMSNFFNEYGHYFEEEEIAQEIKQELIRTIVTSRAEDFSRHEWKKYIQNLIDDNKEVIINSVIENVSNKIITDRKLMEQKPKVKDLISIDKENEKYFIKMINKAIATKFR